MRLINIDFEWWSNLDKRQTIIPYQVEVFRRPFLFCRFHNKRVSMCSLTLVSLHGWAILGYFYTALSHQFTNTSPPLSNTVGIHPTIGISTSTIFPCLLRFQSEYLLNVKKNKSFAHSLSFFPSIFPSIKKKKNGEKIEIFEYEIPQRNLFLKFFSVLNIQ